jgi:hypothetical protein
MSARAARLRAGLGAVLLALYPEAWRDRYGREVRVLLEDDPPRAGGLASLLLGAADAHVRPQRSWREGVTPSTSMRLSVGALFACWMLVALAGSAFAKETEGFGSVEHEHGLLIAARDMITIGAFVGASAVALGGLPLLWQAHVAAVRRHDGRLAAWLAAPALAGGLLVALAALLLFLAPARHGRFPASFVLATIVPLTLAALACASVGALAPKAVMRRAKPPARLLRLASLSGQALTVAILLVTVGLLLYVPALWSVSAGAGTATSGPFGLSTRVTLCFSVAAALVAAGPALLAATRARRAALSRA